MHHHLREEGRGVTMGGVNGSWIHVENGVRGVYAANVVLEVDSWISVAGFSPGVLLLMSLSRLT